MCVKCKTNGFVVETVHAPSLFLCNHRYASKHLFFECEIPLREETENDGDESGEHF